MMVRITGFHCATIRQRCHEFVTRWAAVQVQARSKDCHWQLGCGAPVALVVSLDHYEPWVDMVDAYMVVRQNSETSDFNEESDTLNIRQPKVKRL